MSAFGKQQQASQIMDKGFVLLDLHLSSLCKQRMPQLCETKKRALSNRIECGHSVKKLYHIWKGENDVFSCVFSQHLQGVTHCQRFQHLCTKAWGKSFGGGCAIQMELSKIRKDLGNPCQVFHWITVGGQRATLHFGWYLRSASTNLLIDLAFTYVWKLASCPTVRPIISRHNYRD